jgi:hypothetical protein
MLIVYFVNVKQEFMEAGNISVSDVFAFSREISASFFAVFIFDFMLHYLI